MTDYDELMAAETWVGNYHRAPPTTAEAVEDEAADEAADRQAAIDHWTSGVCECDVMRRTSCPVHGTPPDWLRPEAP